MTGNRYFVLAVQSRGRVKGYGVYDELGSRSGPRLVRNGLFLIKDSKNDPRIALHLANTLRDDLIRGVE
jgi:hypothetical protein